MEPKKRKPYKPRTLKGAEVYVRNLRTQLDEMERYLVREQHNSRMLARLAATGPVFNRRSFENQALLGAAVNLRDRLLAELGMNPDGTPQENPPRQ